jgi:hypothetical protein
VRFAVSLDIAALSFIGLDDAQGAGIDRLGVLAVGESNERFEMGGRERLGALDDEVHGDAKRGVAGPRDASLSKIRLL